MKIIFSLSLILTTIVSCAVLKGGSTNTNVQIDLTELPKEKLAPLQSNFSLSKVDQKNNQITLNKIALDTVVSSFISTAILNDKVNEFDFYFEQSRPRLRYWEYIVSQLPNYVDYGYEYNSYSSESADEKGQMLAFLSYRVNRDSKNISALFEQSKETIYKLISKDTYDKYRLNEYVETLLETFDHLKNLNDYDDQMVKIYDYIMAEDKIEDIFGRTSHQYPIYEPIINQNVQAKYFGSNGMVLNEYGEYTDVLWFHSFWVRRYHEGNSEIVVGILEEIKKHYDEA